MKWTGLSAVLMVLAACAEHETLPQAGAQGPIRMWQWESGRSEPVVLVADELRQISGRPGGSDMVLDLRSVRLSVPFSDGLAEVSAPDGFYAATGDPQAMLPAPTNPTGMVTMVLEFQGVPGIGQAKRAWIPAGASGPHLEAVELVHAGLHSHHNRAILSGATMQVEGQGWSRSAPPAVTTALAALPKGILVR